MAVGEELSSRNVEDMLHDVVPEKKVLNADFCFWGSYDATAQWAEFLNSRIALLFKFSFFGHLHIAEILKSGFSSVWWNRFLILQIKLKTLS